MAADLSQIVKAYDVRGVVPDQWDESLAELFGAAFVRVTGRGRDRDRARHAALVARPVACLRARGGGARRRRDGDRPVLDGPAVLRLGRVRTCRARCSRPRTTRPSTTASRCAARARPRSARTPASPRSANWSRGGRESGAPEPAADAGNDHAAGHVDGLRGAPPRPRRPDLHPPPEGRRRRGQRHGRPHRPDGLRGPAAGRSSRCTSSWTAPSRTTRPTRWTRRTSSTSSSASARRAPTSASPSTATRTAASSSTRTATRSPRPRSPPWWPRASSPGTAARAWSSTT